MAKRANPAQRALPLPPQEPAPAQIHAEVLRMWMERPHLNRTYPTLDAALHDPGRARLLRLCARAALMARQRKRHP